MPDNVAGTGGFGGKERTYSISELAQEFDITRAPSATTRTRG